MLNLTGGGLSGGYKKYLQRLVPRLVQHQAISELLVAVPPGHEGLPGLGDNVMTWPEGDPWRRFPSLQRNVRAWHPDVVLIPTARYLDCGVPVVSMVRNMEPMLPSTLRDGFSTWLRQRLGERIARRTVARSTRVIAVSEFVRDFLVREWHTDPRRVGVVYHGVDRKTPCDGVPLAFRALADTPFLFAAGSLLPYRGLEDAINALPHISATRVMLAIAGDGSKRYQARMRALATGVGVADRVIWLGHLPESVMTWAYQQSLAFLMTSRVEACPNTALEALANGSMSISTRCPPMPEFFGDTARYYERDDARGLACQIDAVAGYPREERAMRAVVSEQRAAAFSWDATADRTVHELHRAVAER